MPEKISQIYCSEYLIAYMFVQGRNVTPLLQMTTPHGWTPFFLQMALDGPPYFLLLLGLDIAISTRFDLELEAKIVDQIKSSLYS